MRRRQRARVTRIEILSAAVLLIEIAAGVAIALLMTAK